VETVSRADYFDTALVLLAQGGEAAVRIAALCDRLGVTKGSFYHHFPSGPAFHEALLAHWEATGAARLREALDDVSDPLHRIGVLKRLGGEVDHEAESAIRAWGKSYPPAAAVQQRVDSGRERILRDAYVAAGIPLERAATLARIGVAVLVGAQQMEHPVDRTRISAAFDEYERWLLSAIRAERRTARGAETTSPTACST
jgi:AcrR family transcriptional regulator